MRNETIIIRMMSIITSTNRRRNEDSPSGVPVYGICRSPVESHFVLVICPLEYMTKGVL